MKNKFFLKSFIFISMILTSCSYKYVSSNTTGKTVKAETIKELNTTVEKIVNAGGNIRRGKAIVKRAKDYTLSDYTNKERIDWFSFQKNIVIEIKGKTDEIVYLVAHYDKTDANPLKLVSLLLNGVLDEAISWSYTSDGAIDNATGVAVCLQLAKSISELNLKYTYRILLAGSEESGLRGSRAHVSSLSVAEFEKIRYMINIDVTGVKGKQNCVYNLSDQHLMTTSLDIAKEMNINLGLGQMPLMGSGDYVPFRRTTFPREFFTSFKYNITGSLLPQRSYFTKRKRTKVINFSSCKILDIGDLVAGTILIPIGQLHSFRDNIKLVDEQKLYEQYALTLEFIKRIDKMEEL